MKAHTLTAIACVHLVSFGLHAASLTGDGYIYITKPSASWTPPSGVYDTPRFLWYPDKMAIRFGDLTSSGPSAYWNDSNIGVYSFAGGLNSMANGIASFAFGEGAHANYDYSTALGSLTQAAGENSVAIGFLTSAGMGGVAIGEFVTAAPSSTALGGFSTAGVEFSTAVGYGASADGWEAVALGMAAYTDNGGAVAIGANASSIGIESIAAGYGSEANADYSTVVGPSAYTQSFGSVALGMNTLSKRMNGINASPSTPQADDPVFMVSQAELGTEPGDAATVNALTIYRNGTAHFNGLVRVKPAGDISMGGFTSVPSGVAYP